MTMRNSILLLISICLSLSLATITLAEDPATTDKLKQMMTDKQYRDVLRESSRVLALKGKAAEAYNRVEIMNIKAESLLQLKQMTPAAEAFAEIANEKTASDDEKDLAIATGILMKSSDAKGYLPPVTKDQPSPKLMDIFDPAVRKDAFPILFTLKIALEKQIVAKLPADSSAKSLLAIAKQTIALQPLERVATKSTDETTDLLNDVIKLYTTQTLAWTDKSKSRLTELQDLADQIVETKNPQARIPADRVTRSRRGLNTSERNEVQQMIKDCERIVPAHRELTELVGKQGAQLQPVQSAVESLYSNAQQLYKQDLIKTK